MIHHSGISSVVKFNLTLFSVWLHVDGQLCGKVLSTFSSEWSWNGQSVRCRHVVYCLYMSSIALIGVVTM